MDALKSFAHLTDNVPHWLQKLNALSAQVAEQHQRFTRLSQAQTAETRLSKKHDSTESLRPPKDEQDFRVKDTVIKITETSVPPSDTPPTSYPAVKSAVLEKDFPRKRKSGSAEFSNTSGPPRYRTRSMTVVYYDSAIQEALESLVRDIAGARNNLRKGRTAATFKARMISMGMDDSDGTDCQSMLNPKSMVKSAPRGTQPNLNRAFDQADKELEAAQGLCEVAAHQFLRDGDCKEELLGTRQKFEECLKIAKEEVEACKRKAEDSRPDEKSETEGKEMNSVESRVMLPIDPPNEAHAPISIVEKVQAARTPTVPTLTSSGTIEVDDNCDTDSIHIDLSAFRRTRRI